MREQPEHRLAKGARSVEEREREHQHLMIGEATVERSIVHGAKSAELQLPVYVMARDSDVTLRVSSMCAEDSPPSHQS